MKKRFLLSAAATLLSVAVFGQVPLRPTPPIVHHLGTTNILNNELPSFNTNPSFMHGLQQQRPTSIKQRLVLQTNVNNNAVVDSLHFLYSHGRGSETIANGLVPEYFTSPDTGYYYANSNNFSNPYPYVSLTYNSNNRALTLNYFDANNIINHLIHQTWDGTNTFMNYSNDLSKYIDNSGGYSDFYYIEKFLSAGGYVLHDSAVYDYSVHDTTLNSNFMEKDSLTLDIIGRPSFQTYFVSTINYIEIDSSWKFYTDTNSFNILKDSTVVHLDSTSGGNLNALKIIDYAYNSAGLLDSMTSSWYGQPYALETTTYNVTGQITSITDFMYNSLAHHFLETNKVIASINSQNMWDTLKYYTDDVLSSKVVSTFNTNYNNITSQTQYTYAANGTVTATRQVFLFYEDYDDLGIESAKNNLKVALFPNPFNNNLTLYLEDAVSNGAFELSITDINGRIIRQQKINHQETIIPTANLSQGVYLIQVNNKEKGTHYSEKIIRN